MKFKFLLILYDEIQIKFGQLKITSLGTLNLSNLGPRGQRPKL